jgi:AcrR family transcriptional regulator
MQNLLSQIKITVNPATCLKQPDSSDLGKRIVAESTRLVVELGFEQFTIKKLADSIGTTEGSVYRYFENKHKILLYLVSWFWGFIEYRLVFSLTNIKSAEEQLRIALRLLINPIDNLESSHEWNLQQLHSIVIEESAKTYLTRHVEKENEDGAFSVYKRVCNRLAAIVKQVNPDYAYPNSLISLVIDGILRQQFYKMHLPSLSDSETEEDLLTFTEQLILNTIHQKREH